MGSQSCGTRATRWVGQHPPRGRPTPPGAATASSAGCFRGNKESTRLAHGSCKTGLWGVGLDVLGAPRTMPWSPHHLHGVHTRPGPSPHKELLATQGSGFMAGPQAYPILTLTPGASWEVRRVWPLPNQNMTPDAQPWPQTSCPPSPTPRKAPALSARTRAEG